MNIAVVMGGYSGEAEVSVKSGKYIVSNLDSKKYNIFEVIILKNNWYALINNQQININKEDFSINYNNQKIHFDLLLNTIHGSPGEDGQLQAYWTLLNIPFSGCKSYPSALTFNKKDTLSVLSRYDIPQAKSIYLKQYENIDFKEVESKLNLPFIVKPNQSGSSLGVSKVNKKEDFNQALDFAFKEDNQILIESFLKGIEVSVGVCVMNNEIKILGITEIISENDFFDYEAKYLGKSQEITPARISEKAKNNIDYYTKKIYSTLNITGFARIDYIIVNDIPNFIEVNTNPGLSPASILPQQVKIAGINFSDLLNQEIDRILNIDYNK